MEGESLRFFDRGGGRFRLRENEDSFCLGGTMEEAGLKLSPINDLHLRYGARMVSFSGYSMPLQYKMGVKQEHIHTRTKAGLFDVSHMGQMRLKGDEVKTELERLVPSDIKSLNGGEMRYTVFLNENGGILDDLIVTNASDHLFVVVNAACRQKDVAFLRRNLRCDIEELEDRALLAIQGPLSETILKMIAPGVVDLKFMSSGEFYICGVECFVTRSGYTGEDGFEISMPSKMAEEIAETILRHEDAELIGLGARDSLRLEAGLCLYGQDLKETTTPVEANLGWTVGKRRRQEGGFPGSEIIIRQLKDGVSTRRYGLRPDGRAPARAGTEIFDLEDNKIGAISSGGFGPTVGAPIAMAYIDSPSIETGSKVSVLVRDNLLPATIVALPFITPNYRRTKKM